MEFSFCEPVWAGSSGRWHIRKLTSLGKKFGGGIDTPSLCRDELLSGWDLAVEITPQHLEHSCRKCVAEYKKLTGL